MGLENSSLQMLLAMSCVKSVVLGMSNWTAACLCAPSVGFHCFSWSGQDFGEGMGLPKPRDQLWSHQKYDCGTTVESQNT